MGPTVNLIFLRLFLPILSILVGKSTLPKTVVVSSHNIPRYRYNIPTYKLVQYHEIFSPSPPHPLYHHKKSFLCLSVFCNISAENSHSLQNTCHSMSFYDNGNIFPCYSAYYIEFIDSTLIKSLYFIKIYILCTNPSKCALVKF